VTRVDSGNCRNFHDPAGAILPSAQFQVVVARRRSEGNSC
jgi:hypothetical protein